LELPKEKHSRAPSRKNARSSRNDKRVKREGRTERDLRLTKNPKKGFIRRRPADSSYLAVQKKHREEKTSKKKRRGVKWSHHIEERRLGGKRVGRGLAHAYRMALEHLS